MAFFCAAVKSYTVSSLFSISILFSSIWPIDRTLSVATTPGQREPESDSKKKGILHSPKLKHSWSLIIRLFSVLSWDTCWGETYLSAEMQSVYSTAPSWPSTSKSRQHKCLFNKSIPFRTFFKRNAFKIIIAHNAKIINATKSNNIDVNRFWFLF